MYGEGLPSMDKLFINTSYEELGSEIFKKWYSWMQRQLMFQAFVENGRLILNFIWKHQEQETLEEKEQERKVYSSGYKELL